MLNILNDEDTGHMTYHYIHILVIIYSNASNQILKVLLYTKS